MDPYRSSHLSTWYEEELWLRLDDALELSLRYPQTAYAIAWNVWLDSRGYEEVRRAACDLMGHLAGVKNVA